MPDQAPLDRRAARHGCHTLPLEPEQDRPRTPPRMLAAQLHDPRLHHRRHLMRARQRPRRPIRQPPKPVGRIAPQPVVQRLARHAIAASHVGDRRTIVDDLEHRLIALLHQPQLHEHRWPPRRSAGANDHSEGGATGRRGDPGERACVRQVPGPLSPRYRGRVREVSTSYRGHGVQHEPGPHMPCLSSPGTRTTLRPR